MKKKLIHINMQKRFTQNYFELTLTIVMLGKFKKYVAFEEHRLRNLLNNKIYNVTYIQRSNMYIIIK